jgi:uncharacterized protein (TIGR00255 family)
MIFSMTGIGSGVYQGEQGQLSVSIRSVNSRFFDLQVRTPGRLAACESAVRQYLQERLTRGKVSVHIDWEQTEAAGPLPELDEQVVQRYTAELNRLKELTDHQGQSMGGQSEEGNPATDGQLWSIIARMPGVFRTESVAPDLEGIQAGLLAAVGTALEDFEQMRQAEGEALCRDLMGRLAALDDYLDKIEAASAADRAALPQRLRAKIDDILRPGEVDPDRLAMEVAVLAERSDITEEFVRFRSHNAQFRAALEKGGEVGRRLNFLLQEMNREANTIASKSTASDAVHLAVEIKEEVERLREQIQNLA